MRSFFSSVRFSKLIIRGNEWTTIYEYSKWLYIVSMMMWMETEEWYGVGLTFAKRDIHGNRIEDYLSKFRSIIMTACVCVCVGTHLKGARDETSEPAANIYNPHMKT